EALENRSGALDLVRGTTDHDAVTVLASPHPTADTDVEVADAPTGELVGTFTVVDVVGIAPLDDQVSFIEKVVQLVDGRAGLFSCGNHHPHRARGVQSFYERVESVDITLVGGHVVTDDLVPLLPQTFCQVPAVLQQRRVRLLPLGRRPRRHRRPRAPSHANVRPCCPPSCQFRSFRVAWLSRLIPSCGHVSVVGPGRTATDTWRHVDRTGT